MARRETHTDPAAGRSNPIPAYVGRPQRGVRGAARHLSPLPKAEGQHTDAPSQDSERRPCKLPLPKNGDRRNSAYPDNERDNHDRLRNRGGLSYRFGAKSKLMGNFPIRPTGARGEAVPRGTGRTPPPTNGDPAN